MHSTTAAPREIAFAGFGGSHMGLEARLYRTARSITAQSSTGEKCEPQVRAIRLRGHLREGGHVGPIATVSSIDDCELASPGRSGTWACRSRSARACAQPNRLALTGMRMPTTDS